MTAINFDKGPNTSGHALHIEHVKHYDQVLSVRGNIEPPIKLISSHLGDYALVIQNIQTDLKLNLAKEDLVTATKPSFEEIIKTTPTPGS